ncbi:hypothetical protein QVD17_17758 [Tagetes erecta]|uniref:BZIP domain-containing protein n=1 Tax=Tagetes erecta TaxID=13708 RepID=A0AAD8KWQ5_TARER|nr:hypothetical protein QVD17_17758 [Tagetes erecta]
MADALAVDEPLPIPPLSPFMFTDDVTLPDDFFSFDDDDDFFGNITFNNNHNPSGSEQLFNSTFNQSNSFDPLPSDPQFNSFDNFVSDYVTVPSDVPGAVNVSSSDDSGRFFVDETLNPVTNLDSSPDNFVSNSVIVRADVPGAVNVQSPDDFGICVVDEAVNRVMNLENSNSSSELRNMNPASSQGSGNCGSNGSEAAVNYPSPDSGNSVVNQTTKRETGDNFMLKRKNVSTDVNSESRMVKHQRSNNTSTTTENSNRVNEEDDKKKARLIRNRESAQISRQRKKQYVEELEDKVKGMQATIHDLNARIAYFAAENATLKQQMVAGAGTGTGGCGGAGVYGPGVMYPPHLGMTPMGYPWAPYPPYAVKSYGSQVPLVPIPKLKPQQPVEKSKKDGKKTEGKLKTKTKKVASISFIGLLLFIVLFGGLVPIMNVKFGGVRVTDSDYPVKLSDHKFYNQQHYGRVLMGDEHVNGSIGYNASEPLVASLYVPRNDKLVKIDGSLIINSVLASEKAMAFREQEQQETSKELVPAIPVPTVNRIGERQPRMYRTSSDYQRALPSNEENSQPKHGDGRLQQWFREGLSGLMLSSGMCTEVFQFDTSMASASGAIVPATSAVNITTTENRHNSTYVTTVKNRRVLHGLPIPLPDSTTNITKEEAAGHDSEHEDRNKHNPVSSMVVSVLVDPRETGDGGDVDGGMMGSGGGGKGKSFSRIFVVVLLDSVKYVTYSCMLPLKGTNHHLVTA